MKITRNTPDQLIASDTPWLIGIMLCLFILAFVAAGTLVATSGEWFAGLAFGGFGGGLGLAAFAVFVRRVQLILDRRAGTLTFQRRSLFGYSRARHDLADLTEAVIEEYRGEDQTATYRPTLILTGKSAGPIPIVVAYTNGPGPRRIVEAINSWLKANR